MIEWLARLPTTNARIAVSTVLAVLTAFVVLGCFAGGRDLQEGALALWLSFLTVQSGLDVAQFTQKRRTHMPSPPTAPDIEDAP